MFKEIKNRDAWATIRGFVYQVDITILRWLELSENQILELEKGEDIDIVTRDLLGTEISRELEQIKFRESKISLNQQATIKLLVNYYTHKVNNSGHKLSYRFLTNTDYKVESPALFSNGRGAIEVWNELRNTNQPLKDDSRLWVIKEHLQNKIKEILENDGGLINESENWQSFYNYIDGIERFEEFLKEFEWSINEKNSESLNAEIENKLINEGYCENPDFAYDIYSRLFLYIFKILTTKGVKLITQSDLKSNIAKKTINDEESTLLKTIKLVVNQLSKRMDDIEEVSLNQTNQISSLLNQVDRIESSFTEFEYHLENISISPPATLVNGSSRKKKVSEVELLLKSYCWVAIHGINGTGKSQLAALVSSSKSKVFWLDFRSFKYNSEKGALLIETFLSNISKMDVLPDRTIWMGKVIKSIPKFSLIVFNDLPQIDSNSSLGPTLILFVNHLIDSGLSFLTTSNYTIPFSISSSIPEKTIIEYDDLTFTDEEIEEYLINNGADGAVLQNINLITGFSYRNPRIVTAIIHHLKSINWGRDSKELFDVIFTKQFSGKILSDAQSSINRFIKSEEVRNLLYRLSLIHCDFNINSVKYISNVDPQIPHPFEQMGSLINIWIQENKQTYQISPLIYDIGENNLNSDIINNVYIEFAKSVLASKPLNQITAFRCLSYFIKGEDFNSAGKLLYNIYKSAQTKNEAFELEKWGYYAFPLNPELINKINVPLKCLITTEQIRLYRLLGKDINPLTNILNLTIRDSSLSVGNQVLLRLAFIYSLDEKNFKSQWENIDFIINNWKELSIEYQIEFKLNMFSQLLLIHAHEIKSKEDIVRWLIISAKIKKILKINIFNSEFAQGSVTLLCGNIVASANLQNDRKVEVLGVVERLNLLSNHFIRIKNEILQAVVAKELIGIEFNERKNIYDSEQKSKVKIEKYASKIAKYLIAENIGKLFFRINEIQRSYFWLSKAIHFDCPSQINFIDTLIYGAAAISNSDTQEAENLCARALQLANSTTDFYKLDYIQFQGELAISNWLNQNFMNSFSNFEKLITLLFELKTEPIEQNWIRLLSWAGNALGYIASYVNKDPLPTSSSDGHDYIIPYIGLFSFNTKDLSKIYQSKNDPIIFTHLARFAAGINEIEKAYLWSLKAFDLARRNGDNGIFFMVSAVSAQYSVINFKPEEAFESTLLYAAAIEYIEKTPDRKNELIPDINFDEMFASKPSNKWNIAEEHATLFSIIPLYLTILISFNKNLPSKEEGYLEFSSMLKNYYPKSSNKINWNLVMDLTDRIVKMRINIKELTALGNTFGEQGHRALQIICILGVLYQAKKGDVILTQLVNITPFLAKIFKGTPSLIKFVLVPFTKSFSIKALNDSYVGNKDELLKIIETIDSVDISKNYNLQEIIKVVSAEMDLELSEDRNNWLYSNIDI